MTAPLPWYVRIDRPDGSRGYVGPLTASRAAREARARADAFPDHNVIVVAKVDARSEVTAYVAHCRRHPQGGRWFPASS